MTSEARGGVASHVHRAHGMLISVELARIIVHWLGSYARMAIDRNGCPPDGLTDVQRAIGEAIIDSRPREEIPDSRGTRIPFIAGSDTEGQRPTYDADAAAAVLGIRPTTVRWHLAHGNLHGRKVRGRWDITADELHRFRRERDL